MGAQVGFPTEDIVLTLQRIITPVTQKKLRRMVESITLLRRLYDINTLVYRAAWDAWSEDYLDYCNLLDSSGVSAMVADYARFLLDQGFSFEKAVQPDFPYSDPETQEFAQVAQALAPILLEEWRVPYDKYKQFWPYIDRSMQKLFAPPLPIPSSQFLIEPAARRVFSMLDQEDAFPEWEHLRLNWKVFFTGLCHDVGGLVAAAGLAGIPVTLAVGIVAPPIALAGAGAGLLLLVAANLGIAAQ